MDGSNIRCVLPPVVQVGIVSELGEIPADSNEVLFWVGFVLSRVRSLKARPGLWEVRYLHAQLLD